MVYLVRDQRGALMLDTRPQKGMTNLGPIEDFIAAKAALDAANRRIAELEAEIRADERRKTLEEVDNILSPCFKGHRLAATFIQAVYILKTRLETELSKTK